MVFPLPGVPAIGEFYPKFEAQSWVGVLAPGATPRNIIQRLNAEIVNTLAVPDIKERFEVLGLEPVTNTPEEFAAQIRQEIEKWGKVIRDANIKTD